MNYSTYRFTLDLQQTKSQVCINVLYMVTGVQFFVSLTDGGLPYKFANGCTAKLYAKRKPTESYILGDCEILDGTRINYKFGKNTAATLGTHECEFRIYGTNGEDDLLLITPSFTINVFARVVNDNDIIDSGAYDFTALDEVFASEIVRKENEEARVEAEIERNDNETARQIAEVEREKTVAEAAALLGDVNTALVAILRIQDSLMHSLEYKRRTSPTGDYYVVTGIGAYNSSHLVIPDTYNGIIVTEIAENAFRGNASLTSATIGKNITVVGKCAFEGCSNLASIQLTRERMVYEAYGSLTEDCYAQSDMIVYSRLASDSDPAKVASLWTTTQDESGYGEILSTDAWYWTSLPA